jgi:hypothetical protein
LKEMYAQQADYMRCDLSAALLRELLAVQI